jgi:thiamine biosynthesis lipoprotein
MCNQAMMTARADRTLMGVSCVITIVGDNAAVIAHHCLDYVSQLERLWSRFDVDSDISRLNNSNGQPMWVDTKTTELLRHVLVAHSATGGLFNPSLLPLQIAEGDALSLIDNGRSEISEQSRPYTDLALIELFEDGRIAIPADMSLDMGGVAKGFAADATVQFAQSLGAAGVCVNIGGDMAMNTGDSAGWDVQIASPKDYNHILDTVRIAIGGVATSSLFARSRSNAGIPSHLFNGRGPYRTDKTVGATVIANSSAWAEVWTKFAIISEPAHAISTLNNLGLAAMLVASDESTLRTETWKNFAHE